MQMFVRSSLALALAAVSGPIAAEGIPAELSGGFTAIAQTADHTGVKPNVEASVDLGFAAALPQGTLEIYVEGSSTPRADAASATFGEVNADAGTALHDGAEGTFQVSEFKYAHDLASGAFTVGVLDATAYMDFSLTSNDENAQFIGASFVNNGVIEFPDYALGAVYQQFLDDEGSEVFVVATSSHGFGDNPTTSYDQMFKADSGEGAFVAAGLRLGTMEVGLWTNTADHTSHDGSKSGQANSGAWAVLGAEWGDGHAADLRLGYADPVFSMGTSFAALSYHFQAEAATWGVGVARVMLSDKAAGPGFGDITHAETYLNVPLADQWALTADVQYIENSGFDTSLKGTVISGLRLNYAF